MYRLLRSAIPIDLVRSAWFVGVLCAVISSSSCEDEGGGGNSEMKPAWDPKPAVVVKTPGDEAGHQKMLAVLEGIKNRAPDENQYLGPSRARKIRRVMAQAAEKGNFPDQKWFHHRLLGWAEMNLGNEIEGIKHLKLAFDLLPKVESQIKSHRAHENIFMLGVAWMRRGETQNCCARFTPESCILPIRGGGLHTDEEGSRNAIKYFTELLRRAPADSKWHYRARWLLNIAWMTIGGHPAEVPVEYLIPSETFESTMAFPRFMNISASLGLDTFNLSGGVIMDDFDNDHYLDVLTTSWAPDESPRLFTGNRDGTFQDRSKPAGLEGIYGGLNLEPADYNNDGNLDILVLRGAWLAQAGGHPNSLLRNNGDGSFTDVTFPAGLGEIHRPSQTAGWADFDNDGDLDLFVGNETTPEFAAPCQLFRNEGADGFKEMAVEAGVTNDRFTKGVTWGDYDNDRYPDFYVSNYRGPNRLYHNNRDGTFTDVAPDLGLTGPELSFPAWFWDFDNDGNLDIFASSYGGVIAEVAAHKLGAKTSFEPICLYRGDGKGGFEDVAESVGLHVPVLPMGSNFGDLNNDGYLDFYLGTGDPGYGSLVPNLMFLNQGGLSFVDVSMAGGFAHLQKGHAVAFGDLDHDGDLDVFEQMGGAYPGDKYRDALFENPGFGNHSLTVRLVGRKSNRSAIGVRIVAEFVEDGNSRSVHRHVTSGGSFGANPLRQIIGLGKATSVTSLKVFWPTTGKTQTFSEVSAGQTIQIVEGENRFTILKIEAAPFRKSSSQ
ncbi:MAG: CRTAC1 family protein [Akkermansiaceae bacterium]|nr:CRTAC1 family protein [Akkermansiaceae bacterium]